MGMPMGGPSLNPLILDGVRLFPALPPPDRRPLRGPVTMDALPHFYGFQGLGILASKKRLPRRQEKRFSRLRRPVRKEVSFQMAQVRFQSSCNRMMSSSRQTPIWVSMITRSSGPMFSTRWIAPIGMNAVSPDESRRGAPSKVSLP